MKERKKRGRGKTRTSEKTKCDITFALRQTANGPSFLTRKREKKGEKDVRARASICHPTQLEIKEKIGDKNYG